MKVDLEKINNLRLIAIPQKRINLLLTKHTTVEIVRNVAFSNHKWKHEVSFCQGRFIRKRMFSDIDEAKAFMKEQDKLALTPIMAFPDKGDPKAEEFACFITYPELATRIKNRTIGSVYPHSAHAFGWRCRVKGIEAFGGAKSEEEGRNKILQAIVDNSLWITRKKKS